LASVNSVVPTEVRLELVLLAGRQRRRAIIGSEINGQSLQTVDIVGGAGDVVAAIRQRDEAAGVAVTDAAPGGQVNR
jgi:hypothetical protein